MLIHNAILTSNISEMRNQISIVLADYSGKFEPPFSEISISDIIEGIRESPVNNTPVQYHQLYENCWKREPNQRPDIGEAHRVLNQLKLQFNNDEPVEIIATRNFSDLNDNDN